MKIIRLQTDGLERFRQSYETLSSRYCCLFQVCSSSFVPEEWIQASYRTNLTQFKPSDARTVVSSYAQFLRSFCTLSQSALAYASEYFLASPIVTAQALSTSLLKIQVGVQVNLTQSSGSWLLASTLVAHRISTSTNQLMNGLSTNTFAYTTTSNTSGRAILTVNGYNAGHDATSDSCYCYSGSSCLITASIDRITKPISSNVFYVENTSIPVGGIQVGCHLMESALTSTLECYYDPSCINLLVPNGSMFAPLNSSHFSHFPQDATVDTLFHYLMVEEWLSSVSPQGYYAQCAPASCTYSFRERNSIIGVFTILIALFGGLNVSLRIVVPLITRIVVKCKWKSTTVAPIQVSSAASDESRGHGRRNETIYEITCLVSKRSLRLYLNTKYHFQVEETKDSFGCGQEQKHSIYLIRDRMIH